MNARHDRYLTVVVSTPIGPISCFNSSRPRKSAEFAASVSRANTAGAMHQPTSSFRFLHQLMQALSRLVADGAQMRVRSISFRKVVAVLFAQGADLRVSALLPDLSGLGRTNPGE